MADIVLGFDTHRRLSERTTRSSAPSSAATATASRKGSSRSTARPYTLATNNGPNHLHGGDKGFDKQSVDGASPCSGQNARRRSRCTSPDGEEGYPGTLKVARHLHADRCQRARRRLRRDDRQGDARQPDAAQLLQSGGRRRRRHPRPQLMINADRYTPVDETLIPTGELAPVEGTPFDFRTPTAIGARIDAATIRSSRTARATTTTGC